MRPSLLQDPHGRAHEMRVNVEVARADAWAVQISGGMRYPVAEVRRSLLFVWPSDAGYDDDPRDAAAVVFDLPIDERWVVGLDAWKEGLRVVAVRG